MRIGVIDSGVGGLTVLKELINKYPQNNYFYCGDNINIPYGSKNKEQLITLTDKMLTFLLKKKVEMIIIACGTISSNIYNELKEKYTTPIYEIISPTIDYLKKRQYKKVALLATPMTVKSKAFENTIKIACPLFVSLIENNDYGLKLDEAINLYLSSLNNIDALILGCTHYPIIEDKIRIKLKNVDLINMGKILCDNLNIINGKQKEIKLYFSKVNPNLIANIDRIIKDKYELEEIHYA